MKLLFLGDIVGRPGRDLVRRHVRALAAFHRADFVIANGENAAGGAGMARWRDRVFAVMARNAGSITDFFNIPTNRVIELGTRIEI